MRTAPPPETKERRRQLQLLLLGSNLDSPDPEGPVSTSNAGKLQPNREVATVLHVESVGAKYASEWSAAEASLVSFDSADRRPH